MLTSRDEVAMKFSAFIGSKRPQLIRASSFSRQRAFIDASAFDRQCSDYISLVVNRVIAIDVLRKIARGKSGLH